MVGINTSLAILFLISFLITLILTKFYIQKARKKGLTVKDMYKENTPEIPTMGGLIILAGTMFTLIAILFLPFSPIPIFIFYFIILLYSFYGLADDLLGFKKRKGKVLLLFILALPVALLTIDTNLSFFSYTLELGWIYAFIFAPIYIMVISNLVNMHAGFNGLSSGLTLIMLFFAGLKSYLLYQFTFFPLLIPVFGSLLAFWFYNKYPAKIFDGNIGAFLMGGALGAFLVISNLEWFGVIILIPHMINFILWIYWCCNMKKYPHIKFGRLRKNNTIEAPNYFTLKYIACKLFKVNEWQATKICYLITIVFCIIGVLI